jgi:hypothetical protein
MIPPTLAKERVQYVVERKLNAVVQDESGKMHGNLWRQEKRN